MMEHQVCNIICRIELDEEGAKELKEKIEDDYMVRMYGNPSPSHIRLLDLVMCTFVKNFPFI